MEIPKIAVLNKINRDLDKLYDLLYEQFPYMTSQDYNLFGNQLNLLLQTLEQLIVSSEKFFSLKSFENETKKLRTNYFALKE